MSTPSEAIPEHYDPAAPSSRSTVPWILLAVAAVAALVIGGGAVAVFALMGSQGDRPASAMPDTVSAYAQVDIDPGVGQKVAALQFFDSVDTEELEEMRDGRGHELLFDLIAEEDGSPLAGSDYEQDVEPWLGDRAGVGVVPGETSEETVAILAVQVTDEAAADTFFTDVMRGDAAETVDFFFRGDYIVFTEPADSDGVQQALDAGTLADSDGFSSDLEALGEQGVASGWVDLAAFQELSKSVNEQMGMSLGEMGMSPTEMGLTPMQGQDELQGRMAMTLRFDTDAIEVHGAAFSTGTESIEGGDSAHVVTALPDDTAVALGIEHGDQYVDQVWTALESAYPQDVADVQEEAAAAGFTLPQDFKTLLGDSAVIAAGPDIVDIAGTDTSEVALGWQSNTDAKAAEDLVDRVLEMAGEELDGQELPLVYGADGDIFTLAGGQAYYDALVGGGDLSSVSEFENAVPDGADADSVGFVNLNQLEPTYLSKLEAGQERDMVESMAALGARASYDGDGGGTFTMRLVFDE